MEEHIYGMVFYVYSSFIGFPSNGQIFHIGPTISNACTFNSLDVGKGLYKELITFMRLIFWKAAQTFHMRGMLASYWSHLILLDRLFAELFLFIQQAIDTHAFVAMVALVCFEHREVNIILLANSPTEQIHSKISGIHISSHEGLSSSLALTIFHNSLAEFFMVKIVEVGPNNEYFPNIFPASKRMFTHKGEGPILGKIARYDRLYDHIQNDKLFDVIHKSLFRCIL